MRTYEARLIRAANVIEQHLNVIDVMNVIEQHLTKTPCSTTIDTTLHMGSGIPQENPNHITVWRDPHHKRQEMNTLGIYEIQQQRPYILIRFYMLAEPFKRNLDLQGE